MPYCTNKNQNMKTTLLIVIIILTNLSVQSQNDQYFYTNSNKEIIDTVLSCFSNNYVYPKVAESLRDSILLKYKEGEYSQYKTSNDLIGQLSIDLRQITNDKHIGIKYIEKTENSPSKNKHSLLSEDLAKKRKENFNFKKAEWLPGNVGYIRFDIFEDPEYAGNTAASVMNFVSNCDAILIDLRYNYGGEEKMVRFLASYFFLNLRF